MSGNSIAYTPGPISLIFGSESPITSHDVSIYFPSRKRSTCTTDQRQYIHHLSLLGCELVNIKDVYRSLGKKMKRETHLKELAVCSTTPKLGNGEMTYLARGLSKNSNLAVLDLTGAKFDARGLSELKRFFAKNCSLEVLSLGENANVGDEGMDILASLLTQDLPLRVLNLESCGIQNIVTSVPSLMKSVGSSLRMVELSHNSIGDAGLEQLAECMRVDTCVLEYLGLKNTSAGDCGMLQLADALKTNKSLITLNLQNNADITDVGASALLKSINDTYSIDTIVASNHTLKNIDFRGCVNVSEGILYKICAVPNQTVQFKVSKYFESFGCTSALGSMDSLLLPNILSFVGNKNGLDVLFRVVKSIPLLYNRNLKVDSINATDSSSCFTLHEEKSKRLKQFHFVFTIVSKVMSTVRWTDGRNRCKHESCFQKKNNNYLASILSNNKTLPVLQTNYYHLRHQTLLVYTPLTQLSITSHDHNAFLYYEVL